MPGRSESVYEVFTRVGSWDCAREFHCMNESIFPIPGVIYPHKYFFFFLPPNAITAHYLRH